MNPFGRTLYWLLQVSRFGRYSGVATASIEADLHEIAESTSLDGALDRLLSRVPNHALPLQPEDFLREHSESRFGRLLLYLLVHQNIRDAWPEGAYKVGYREVELRLDLRLEWHHIFPRKSLEGKVGEQLIDALANFAVGGPALDVDVTQSGKGAKHFHITEERLKEQYISDDVASVPVEDYATWLTDRAVVLSKAGNDFLWSLGDAQK